MTGADAKSPTPLLAVREVTKRYGETTALDHVSMSAGQGEFVAVLGPSGCGKTTLLRCIAGFVQPDSGGIDIDGRDVTALPPYHRPLNTVFQGYALFPHMSVGENVGYGPARKGQPRTTIEQAVGEALELVGLEGFVQRQPGQLSGGQQQRVALARAIINRPRLLLLDEPLGALDLRLRKQMQIELKRLQTRLGITFLFVTHDQEEAMTMADRIVVMRDGRIEQVGTAREIYDRPRTRFVAEFIGEANLLVLEPDCHGMLRAEIGGPGIVAPPGATARRYLGVLRPECLSTRQADASDAIAATVIRIVDGGGQTLVHLAVAGTELLMRTLGGPGPQLQVGGMVHVGWSADALRPIEDAEANP